MRKQRSLTGASGGRLQFASGIRPPPPAEPRAPGREMGAVEGVLAVAHLVADQQPMRPVAVGHGMVGGLDQAQSCQRGPLAPGPADSRCQALAGSRRASSAAGRAPIPVMTRWCLAIAKPQKQ